MLEAAKNFLGPKLAITSLHGRSYQMLWTVFIILLILWILGVATSFTLHGLIHILLVAALVVIVIRLIQGRRIV